MDLGPATMSVTQLVDLIMKLLSDKEEHIRANALGMPLILHCLIGDEEDEAFFDCLQKSATSSLSPAALDRVLCFVMAWVKTGRRLPKTLKERVHAWVMGLDSSPSQAECLRELATAIEDYSPVLGRWRANNSPRSNMFFWLDRSPQQIAVALTAMCLPFYRLRACEFNPTNMGPHLQDLNLRYNSVSKFVVSAILSCSVLSRKQGIAAMEKWIEVGHELHFLRNYHMLFAVQNALQKHQIDRLQFLLEGVSKKHLKQKQRFDSLFDANDRMRLFLKELALFKGREPLIPCVFWLHQKATLLNETPLFLDDGSLNMQRILSAAAIFRDVAQIQAKRYAPLKEEEQILWYLMRLERIDLVTEDELYLLSDAAKMLEPRRFSLGGAPRQKSSLTLQSLDEILALAKEKYKPQ